MLILLIDYMFFYLGTFKVKKVEALLKYRRVVLHEITFNEPVGYILKKWKDNRKGWNNVYYKILSVGTLQISTKKFDKKYDFYLLLSRFLKVKIYDSIDEKFYIKERVYYKKIKFDKNGAFVLKKNKKGISYVYAFFVGKRFYWFVFYPEMPFSLYKNVFFKVIGSIRALKSGLKSKLSEEHIKKQLSFLCLRSYFLICQSFLPMMAIITIFIVTVGFGFFTLISHFSGKLPEEVKSSSNFVYKEEKVDMIFKTWFSMKFYTSSIAVDDENLYIYKFKKLFAEIPLKDKEILIKKKGGFFYGEHVEIVVKNSKYIKDRYLQGLSLLKKVKITIKLFPSEPERFYFSLKTLYLS